MDQRSPATSSRERSSRRLRGYVGAIAIKVEPAGGGKKAKKVLIWKFDKVEINDMLAEIERLKRSSSLH